MRSAVLDKMFIVDMAADSPAKEKNVKTKRSLHCPFDQLEEDKLQEMIKIISAAFLYDSVKAYLNSNQPSVWASSKSGLGSSSNFIS